MAERVQTYKNHFRILPLYHYFVLPVLFVDFVYRLWQVWQRQDLATAWTAVVAFALVALAFTARVMALKVQDRVIRLEMRQRLMQILPADLQGRVRDLTPQQLVALRFACDAEMPALVREVLEGRLTSTKEIKLKVKQWEPDWLRA